MDRYVIAWIPLILLLLVNVASGADEFIIKDIRIEGLQRISAGTVFNYLPVKVGDKLTAKQSANSIRALFKTGFFKDVRLETREDVLVVAIEERPAIAAIKIDGNKDINNEDLLKALKGIGLSEGKVFNRQILDKVEQELRRQYFSRGKYALKINSEVTALTRNRVGLLINISEGTAAKIKQINVIGNKSYPEDELLDEFQLGTTHIFSFYTKNDQYSKQKLSADLEQLRSFYLDRGYINFDIDSTQVSITPDKKEIYITVNVSEGPIFRLDAVKLSGDLVVAPDELIPLVQVGPGEIFSRKRATETSKLIADRLGEEGYAFANVNMVPDINEDERTVTMTFFVDPGKRVYVRRINMRGNTKTRDEVLRREMRQMESAWASTSKIERSKTRLQRLGYFEDVNVETEPVSGTQDQIDVNYSVTEKASGNLLAGFGFSQAQGFILNASVTQDNVLGTGKRVSFSFNNSNVNTIYRVGYINPYYTIDGISRGFDIGYRKTDADRANTANFSTDVGNASVNYGIPLNEFDRLRFNIEYERTKLTTNNNTSDEITDFTDDNGDLYNTVSFSLGWSHDTLNRAIFPSEGGSQRASALVTVPGIDLQFYKLNYRQQHYFPLAKDLTLKLNAEIAYGDGYSGTKELPFFEHYFAGGVNSVRGFQDNTLGPRDSRNDSFGGSSKFVSNVELLIPIPFLEESDSVRIGAFFDAGNVFEQGFEFGDLRYSVGASGTWISPFGALTVSLGFPLNDTNDDDVQNFQFSFGTGF